MDSIIRNNTAGNTTQDQKRGIADNLLNCFLPGC